MKGTKLAVLAPDHNIVYVGNGAGEVVARIGRLPRMPNHLHTATACLTSMQGLLLPLCRHSHNKQDLHQAQLMKRRKAYQPVPVEDSQLFKLCYFMTEVPR